MNSESIRRHFTGPHRPNVLLQWIWHQKGRRYPRETYNLYFSPIGRVFVLTRFVTDGRHSKPRKVAMPPAHADAHIPAFRSLLSAEDIAECTREALNPTPLF